MFFLRDGLIMDNNELSLQTLDTQPLASTANLTKHDKAPNLRRSHRNARQKSKKTKKKKRKNNNERKKVTQKKQEEKEDQESMTCIVPTHHEKRRSSRLEKKQKKQSSKEEMSDPELSSLSNEDDDSESSEFEVPSLTLTEKKDQKFCMKHGLITGRYPDGELIVITDEQDKLVKTANQMKVYIVRMRRKLEPEADETDIWDDVKAAYDEQMRTALVRNKKLDVHNWSVTNKKMLRHMILSDSCRLCHTHILGVSDPREWSQCDECACWGHTKCHKNVEQALSDEAAVADSVYHESQEKWYCKPCIARRSRKMEVD